MNRLKRGGAARQSELLERKALVHGHSHHKALMGMADEENVLERLGLDYEVLDSGRCGMAGAFGFERRQYDVFVAAGRRVLLPAVQGAAPRRSRARRGTVRSSRLPPGWPRCSRAPPLPSGGAA